MNRAFVVRRFALCLIAAFACAAKASTPGADAFLLLPVDAREIGLGQATVGLVSDATAFHRNPAGLGMIGGFDAAASYTRLFSGLANHQMIAVGMPVARTLRVGVSWVRLGVDDIPIYPSLETLTTPDEREIHASQGATGRFGYAQNAFFLTFARYVKARVDLGWQYLTLPMELPVGVTVKYLTASAGDTISASGIGVDVGAQSRFSLGRALDNRFLGDVTLGLALANVGRTRMTWDTPTEQKDTQPMTLLYGATYKQTIPAIRSTVLGTFSGYGRKVMWGLEYTFLEQISFRLGRDMVAENGVSFGAGVEWHGVRLDYALQRHELGATHRVSVHYQR